MVRRQEVARERMGKQKRQTAIGGKDSVTPVFSFVFLQCLLSQSARAKGTQSLSNSVVVAVDARKLVGKFR